jgi:hypothetical protein
MMEIAMGRIRRATKRYRWSSEDENRLKQIYQDATVPELTREFPQVSIRAIQSKANALGVKKPVYVGRTKDVTNARKREYMARKRAEDREGHNKRMNDWYHANKETRRAVIREYHKKRFFWSRQQHLRGKDRATAKDLAILWKKQKGLCALTRRRLDRNANLDHITPKSKNGTDTIDNLRWVCVEANLAKRDLLDADFIKLCLDVVSAIDLGSLPDDIDELA